MIQISSKCVAVTLPTILSLLLSAPNYASAKDCDCDTAPSVDCIEFFDPAKSVSARREGAVRLMPPLHKNGKTTFLSDPKDAFGLHSSLTLPDRAYVFTMGEGAVLFKNPRTDISITIDWVPDGGGPLVLSKIDNQGNEVEVSVFPFPGRSNFLQTDAYSLKESEHGDANQFSISTRGETGVVRVCVSDSKKLFPVPIEDVIITTPE